MSVYRPKGSPYYHYDFQRNRTRFYGSTGRTNEREAKAVENQEKEKVKQAQKAARKATSSLQIDDVAGRYWAEVGKHHSGSANTWRDLERLVEYFKPTTLLTDIHDNEVSHLVAWRRGHRVVRSKKPRRKDAPEAPLISNATVNRSTTEVLKKLFTRAKTWGATFDKEPDWKQHWLPEPQERVRELVGDEGSRLQTATRDDYAPFFDFAGTTALRLEECILRWPEVDWEARQIRKPGKGDKLVTAPITPTVRAILWPLRGHHPEFVFTYIAKRTRGGKIKGQRYPITYSGVKTQWRRMRKRSGVQDFRFHDYRHDVGTKLLRRTGNLKLVQKVLNHSNIKVTTKYAHVLDQEVAAALESLADSRKKSRTRKRRAS